MLFEYGSRDKEKKKEKKHGLPEIDFVDLDLEEDRDKNMVYDILKKYHKAIKHIFVKYSNADVS